jgi:hypothetical protein
MYEKFINNFEISISQNIENNPGLEDKLPDPLFTLLELHGGKTFNKGLYRLHTFKSSIQWSLIIGNYFNRYKLKIYSFGFDWMGRQFCMSSSDDNLLFMFDIAATEYFEHQQDLELLHNDDFVNETDNMLSSDLYSQILKYYNLESIGYNECLGYKIPLFLGGNDSIDNYYLSDTEVYWDLQHQLHEKVKNLPAGTNINSIKIEKP